MGPPQISPAVKAAINANNLEYSVYVLIVLSGIVVALILYRAAIYLMQYLRTVACLNDDKQRFFRRPNHLYSWTKHYMIYAPLFTKRHSRPMRIGPLRMGILPTRLQSLLIMGIIIMNILLCTHGIEWDGALRVKLWHLRNRSGSLAVVNMIPLVIMAGRNNPLIGLLGVSFGTFNLMHRWFGRVVVSLAVTHSIIEIIALITGATAGKKVHPPGIVIFTETLEEARFILWGFVAFVAMVTIVLTSFTAFRHAFYETFLHLHIALVSLILAALWIHLAGLPQLNYLKAVIAVCIIERFLRLSSLLYRNLGRNRTTASCEILPGDAIRVTLCLARPMIIQPGQYIFLTIPSIGLWTSHPFSIAWSDPHPERHTQPTPTISDPEKGHSTRHTTPPYTSDTLSTPQSTLTLLIRRRSGFTARLHKHLSTTAHPLSLLALISTPHGTPLSLSSYGTLLLIAGGIGITPFLPLLRSTLAAYTSRTMATRRITLIWILRSPEHLEWIRPFMTSILAMPKRRECLRAKLFITRPKSAKEICSPSATVQMFPGKPDVESLVEVEGREGVGALGVGVCGPGGLGDDVRKAVRKVVRGREVGFWEEGFGW